MSKVAELYPVETGTPYFGPARVLEIDECEGLARVRPQGLSEEHETWARVAIPMEHRLAGGDEALVAGEDMDNLYVIGLLNTKMSAMAPLKRLMLASGAYAAVDESSESPILRVFSKRNELLFEYDPDTERARVIVESGDLEFSTRQGDIKFNSARNIQIDGHQIELMSRSGIQLGVADLIGQVRSAFSLRPRKINLSSAQIDIAAQRSQAHVEEMRYTGKRFLGKVGYVGLIAKKVETTAKTIMEKAENVYRTVKQLSQLKTGRMRTMVDSTYHLKTKKAFMKSEEDFKVKADKIHLG